ncbi:hypothetical protein Cob_v005001 [Colletotrichum orbiculare MAFF 240422]|uniref:Uncharacterized protein n=1 Tax=Colletotrichum orbiculare (strain 104-T / ATCC 96160 / CBS 514.97 / LARS 414 / MAFF 240422) TaxID=1213857 RepID=A0A484FXY6_COLOR|nr:hypothetical protein Cob_v005001 [Colletotrichum orbiculare MAFF 240422]
MRIQSIDTTRALSYSAVERTRSAPISLTGFKTIPIYLALQVSFLSYCEQTANNLHHPTDTPPRLATTLSDGARKHTMFWPVKWPILGGRLSISRTERTKRQTQF